MVLTEDSRPFTILRKSAHDFNILFNEGIEKCLSTLDSGISDLLCDPDSLVGSSTGANRLSAHMEFSKAKYELFVKMREFFEKFEKDCVEQISEMKEMFLENVEIFLAGTKLEVKLPTSEALSQIEKKRSPSSKVRSEHSTIASPASLYPKLIDSAKKQISRLSSLIPNVDTSEIIEDDEDEMQQAISTPVRQNKSPKRVTILTPQEMERLVAAQKAVEDSAVIDISEESDEEPAVVEITSKRPGRKPAVSTPASQKKIPVRTPVRRNPAPAMKESSSDSGSDSKSANTPIRRRNTKANEKEVYENINVEQKEDSLPQVEIKSRRTTRSQLSTPTVSTPSSTSGRKGRPPRRKADAPEDSQQVEAGPKTPKSVHFSSDIESNADSEIQTSELYVPFSVGMDIHEDLDVYSPDVKISKATPRRKTAVLSRVMDDFSEINLTPDVTRGKSKRKTIAGPVSDEAVAPSPKRLRTGRRSNIMPSTSEDEPMDSNSLASDGASEQEHYSPWMPLSDISGSVPTQPGIYELKVAAAKKPAYIGGCDNLRQKLTLHKLKQNSGHKHLDKFIDRNLSNILVRYEQLSSAADAKSEEKIRVKAFVDRFKNPPAYN
ncbi:nucleolar and coiled-body phosphoprotein 1-like isoform X2 [Argiope bruennichi]|uniref:Uncharacterized protein n=1 Tax=Argiope bruennichi TaxID=94029 RepID=A0A8T0EMK3_ARGBR|nr:nucleolar and coiled-body phosphoprotein 1-like isoform X2 [Argiope bruennichi]KAF8773916.1 hypothetical protein HNY73_016523 [Argiope bruennichi]